VRVGAPTKPQQQIGAASASGNAGVGGCGGCGTIMPISMCSSASGSCVWSMTRSPRNIPWPNVHRSPFPPSTRPAAQAIGASFPLTCS
jgi:hypothetical protein